MTLRTLIRRSLRFHWRGHLGVLLGAAVGSAALIGALVVGDSVRWTLREKALQRLGGVEFAAAPADRFFRDELRVDIEGIANSEGYRPNVAAVLSLAGMAARQDGSARANRVHVYSLGPGLDHFARMPGLTNLTANEVILNEALAGQLRARPGEDIVLRVRKPTALSREIAGLPRDNSTAALRLRVHSIASADALGNFDLAASQAPPFNAFVRADALQNAVGLNGRANMLLAGTLLKSDMPADRPVTVNKFLRLVHKILPSRARSHAEREKASDMAEALQFYSTVLRLRWQPQDAEISVEPVQGRDAVELRSSRIFLDPPIVAAALAPDDVTADGWVRQRRLVTNLVFYYAGSSRRLAVSNGLPHLTYLVNQFRAGERTTPYSMVTAMGAPVVPAEMKDDEILINQWLADDLQVRPGAEISLTYFEPDSGANLVETTNRFRVRGVLPMSGPSLDPSLMPEFPGIAKAESTHDWDAGFPLVHQIRDQDDKYWKDYRGTPKGFVTLSAGQKMWGSRFGNVTGIRWTIPSAASPEAIAESVRRKIMETVPPEQLGLVFVPVRAQALAAAEQAQDFGGLFLGFSFFLIAAALILMALLFQFGLEQRTAETGTLLALGFTPRQVRRLLLREGVMVAFVGGVLGALGGLGYAKGMLHLLSTLWSDAVGGSALQFHVTGATLAIGLLASVVVCAVTIWVVLRRQARRPARELLAEGSDFDAAASSTLSPLTPALSPLRGEGVAVDAPRASAARLRVPASSSDDPEARSAALSEPLDHGVGRAPSPLKGERAGVRGESAASRPNNTRRNRTTWLTLGFGVAALALVGWTLAGGEGASAPMFFGAGALLLVAGLAGVSVLLTALDRSEAGQKLSLVALGLRGCTRRRLRSLASVALLACGSFLIVAVGANRLDAGRDATKRGSGTGGFALFGEATLPIVRDLNTKAGREFYGLDEDTMRGVSVVPFRVRDGDEASCLNLNRAQKPRLLGVNPDLLAQRGAFTFAKVWKGLPADKPWELLRSAELPLGANVNPESRQAGAPRSDDAIPAIGDAASIQWALGKKLGDTLDYTDERGQPFKVRLVAGVANSILQGNLIIDEAEFLRRFPGEAGHRMFLIDTPSNDPASMERVSAALSRALQDAGLELTPATRRLAEFNAVQNTYLNTFQVLGGLGLLLGSAGLGVVLLRNVLERRGELGLLQAVGFTRRSIRWLILSEHGGLLALGLVVGIVSALLAIAPVLLAPGARLHALALGLTLAGVLASGLVWTWLAIRLALRGSLLDALRNE